MSRRGRAAATNTADTETNSTTIHSNHTTKSPAMQKKRGRTKKQAEEMKASPEEHQKEEQEEEVEIVEKQPPTTPLKQTAPSSKSVSSPASSHLNTPPSRLSARSSVASTLTSPASPAAEQHRKLLDVVDQLEKAKGGINTRILQQVFTTLTSYSPSDSTSSGITGMNSSGKTTAKHSKIPAADRPFLNTIAKTLANRSILQHKSEEVRVLTGCCLADILRIYAPDAPYDPPTIKAIFQFFFSLLEHLSKPNTGVHYFYCLEALALVHSPLVLQVLPDHDAQSMTLQLVELLLNQLKLGIKHTGVEGYIAQIVTSVIDEYHTELPLSFIDICLILLAEPDAAQSLTGKFILDVIRARQDTLEPYICKWMRDVFVVPAKKAAKEEQNRKKATKATAAASSTQSSPKADKQKKQQQKKQKSKKKKAGGDDESDVSDESDMDVDHTDEDDDDTGTTRIQDKVLQMNIFRNIHWYLPDLLLGIQGDLLDLLTIDHEPIRLQYTEVYLDIFTHTDRGRVVAKVLPAVYENVLGRLLDITKEVRKTIADRVGDLMMNIYGKRGLDPQDQMMIDGVDDQHASALLDKSDGVSNGLSSSTHAHNVSLAYVWDLLTVSMMEKEADIRTATIRSLSKATVYDPRLINLNLLEMMCVRCGDKKYTVRKEAIIGLSHIFHHHVTKQWRQAQPLSKDQRKFSFLPSRLVGAAGQDNATSLIVELCLDNNVIGMKENEGAPPSAQRRKGKAEDSSNVFSEEEYQQVLTERTRCLTAVYMALEAAEASSSSGFFGTPHDAVPEMLRQPVTPPSLSDEAKALHHFLNRFLVKKQSLHQAIRECINQQQRIFTAKKQVVPTNGNNNNKSNAIKELERTMNGRLYALAQHLYSEEDAELFLPTSHAANINTVTLHKARDQASELITRLLKLVFTAENDTIVHCLYTLTDCHTPLHGFRQAHHDLIQAVTKLVLPDARPAAAASDSKPTKASIAREQQQQKKLNATVLMARVGWSCALTLFPSDSVPCFLAQVQQGMENPARAKMALSAMDLVFHMCQSFPSIFPAGSIESLYSIAQSKEADNQTFTLYALKILAGIDYFSVGLNRSMTKKLEALFVKTASNSNDMEEVRYSIRGLKALLTEDRGQGLKKVNVRTSPDDDSAGADDAADRALSSLFSHYLPKLNLHSTELVGTLAGIGEIVSVYPLLFDLHQEQLLQFLYKQLFVINSRPYHHCILLGIQALTQYLSALALTADMDKIMHMGKNIISCLVKGMVNKGQLTLTPIPLGEEQGSDEAEAADGRSSSSPDEAEQQKQSDRQHRENEIWLTLGKCLIDLCSFPPYHRLIVHVPATAEQFVALNPALSHASPQQLHRLQRKSYHFATIAYLAIHDDESIRISFVEHVLTTLSASKLPFIYVVILCLVGMWGERYHEYKKHLEAQLTQLVQRCRKRAAAGERLKEQQKRSNTSSTATSRTSNGTTDNKVEESSRLTTTKPTLNPALPENCFADLIYLLSYHPEFIDPLDTIRSPTDITTELKTQAFQLYNFMLLPLDYYMDILCTGEEGQQYSLLYAIGSTIKNSVDVRDVHNERIYKLADLLQLLVHKRGHNKSWKNSVNVAISLPAALYRARTDAPKERYLHRDYKLPDRMEQRESAVHGVSGGESSPSRRKRVHAEAAAAADEDDQSEQDVSTSKTSGSKKPKPKKPKASKPPKKPKKEKAVAPPSRTLPSRAARSVISYNEDQGEPEEEEEEEEGAKDEASAAPEEEEVQDESDHDEENMTNNTEHKQPAALSQKGGKQLVSPAYSSASSHSSTSADSTAPSVRANAPPGVVSKSQSKGTLTTMTQTKMDRWTAAGSKR